MKDVYSIALILGGLTPWIMSTVAYTETGEPKNRSAHQHMMGDVARSPANFRISGELFCTVSEAVNEGQGCQMGITEFKTGKRFNIQNREKVIPFYSEGTKNVAIEGALLSTSSQTDVASIQADRVVATEAVR